MISPVVLKEISAGKFNAGDVRYVAALDGAGDMQWCGIAVWQGGFHVIGVWGVLDSDGKWHVIRHSSDSPHTMAKGKVFTPTHYDHDIMPLV